MTQGLTLGVKGLQVRTTLYDSRYECESLRIKPSFYFITKVLWAIGRDPCTRGIGLENVGVDLNPK